MGWLAVASVVGLLGPLERRGVFKSFGWGHVENNAVTVMLAATVNVVVIVIVASEG